MSYDSNLDRLTVIDLRAIAADLKIAGRSKMKRAELVAVITRAEKDAKWDATHSEDNAQQVDADEQPDRASYYSGTVPCFERTTVDGIGYGCVKLGEHVEHNTALGAAWWTPTEAAEQADAEAVELLDAVLGEYVEPIANTGKIAITKYSAHEAIATAVIGLDSIGGHVTRERGRWALRYGNGHDVIRAKTLGKVAKLWAKALSFHATAIDVETMR